MNRLIISRIIINKLTLSILSLLLLVPIILIWEPVDAFSIRELLGLDDEETSTEESGTAKNTASKQVIPNKNTTKNWAKPNLEMSDTKLDFRDIQNIFANLSADQRRTHLADEAAFRKIVKQEADNLSVLEAAKVNKVQADAKTAYLMQRGAENILRESYLNKLIAKQIPADFPSEQQMKEYYEKNKDKFVIGERVHVWQIYLLTNEDMDKKAIAKIENQANSIVKEIQQGKLEFSAASIKYSEHDQSKANGGYMGLIKVSELKPGIDNPLLALAQGEISKPVKTETGVHILKRGAIVPAQDVSYAQIQGQIKSLLLKQARAQLRIAIYNQARRTYPVELKDNKVEEWRLRLRTNRQAKQ